MLAGVDSRPDLKRRWRQWWFVTHAAQVFASDYAISAPRLRVVGEPETEGIVAVVQNGRPWTYFGQRPITVSRDAGLQTGSLAATVVDRPLPWDFLPMGWRVFSGRGAEGHSRVKTVHSDGFTIEPIDEPTIDLHVDGDPLGAVERAEYGLRRDALTILA